MKKNNKGFTMAELLIVVAIIVVLMGVAFIAVQNYQRSSTRLEFDGIAKEIFIAAQNHLTTAESQGYLQLTSEQKSGDLSKELGYKGDSSFDINDERYFVYNAGNTYSKDPQKAESVLDLMLPFGAIDETVRAGGRYIIRYQPSSGRVLDVFYSLPGKSSLLTVSGVNLSAEDYVSLMTEYRGDAKARESYKNGAVGWYGGEKALPTGQSLKAPDIVVHNEEVLWVEVTDHNNGQGSLQLTITGVTSRAQKCFVLGTEGDRVSPGKEAGQWKVILDDITTNGYHFSDLPYDSSKDFIPGEDIIVEAVAYSNTALTNVAYSGQKRTNSLFAEIQKDTTTECIALVENFRHFENLDQKISGAFKKESAQEPGYETISKAIQIKNLIWTEKSTDTTTGTATDTTTGTTTGTTTDTATEKPDSFIEAVQYINPLVSSVSIYDTNNNEVASNNCLYPVSPEYKLEYDGKSNNLNHKVSNVVVSGNVDAGLFGKLSVQNSAVKNLELIDFTITGTASAGALAGSVVDTTITNVLVHNSIDKEEKLTQNIESSGTAGGLIGSVIGGSVTECAAAVYVSGSTNAGGLIGEVTSGTVTSCYSGGHTDGPNTGTATYYKDGKADYDETTGVLTNGLYNVISASGAAGGLIGDAGSASISYSYSTCSAKGTTVGGLIGTGSGSVTGCYATGLVKGSSEDATGAFAGSFSGAISTDENKESYYYRIINEIHSADGTISYLHAIGNEKDSTDVKALDETADSYNKFVGADWKETVLYDTDLVTFYQGKYPLKTVVQLGAVLPEAEQEEEQIDWFITTHYGDWPAPEIFIINQ